MPMLPDESIEQFEARLKHAETKAPQVDARGLSAAAYRHARRAAIAGQRSPAVAIPVVGGRLARELSPQEYRAALNELRNRFNR